jgi:hypothetical protein
MHNTCEGEYELQEKVSVRRPIVMEWESQMHYICISAHSEDKLFTLALAFGLILPHLSSTDTARLSQ